MNWSLEKFFFFKCQQALLYLCCNFHQVDFAASAGWTGDKAEHSAAAEVQSMQKLSADACSSWTSLLLVLISVLLTGTGIYPRLAKWGGAGALVPITGFANSVAAPAIEYKKEGQVFGIGCKIFTIAGPVILYGIVTSWALGLLYWVWTLLN